MNWHRFTQVQNVPPSQAALALGMIGLGHAWVLYYPAVGMVIRPYLAFSGALLLLP
ncbi:tellurite resistance protein, partial [Vibrio cholerae O1]|nr:tellurite resistance protein [Vibrio cholerae O1]